MPPTIIDRRQQATPLLAHALYVSSGNARELIGQSPRWVRDFARRKNLPVLRAGGKWFLKVGDLVAALETEAAAAQPEPAELSDAEQLARLRDQLGWERVG